MLYKDLVIIDNEKISIKNNNFYCDNFEAQISQDLKKFYNVTLIARNSKINRAKKINLVEVKLAKNIFSFLYNIFNTFKKKDINYLIIAINPYTFLSYLFLKLFRKKIFVYLRSDGHEEYKAILGFFGPAIYNIMYRIVTKNSKIISCQERLFKKNNASIVFPSELNSLWLENKKMSPLDKPRLLYIGRIKVEKGIFSLLKIFNEMKMDAELTVVGREEGTEIDKQKINFLGPIYDVNELVKTYDSHNIFILPSFTEAHPKVIDESLARGRPVIIFDEISHVIKNKKGIFISKRNSESLLKQIHFIMKNYQEIQKSMLTNKLPTKEDFILQMNNVLR